MKSMWLAAAGLASLLGPAVLADEKNMAPDVGKDVPEFSVQGWINSEGRTTVASMKGEVILLANWKTS